ncbi:MAG: hypothetical protein ACREI1_02580, partial [Nitrospiraceae bacterium]
MLPYVEQFLDIAAKRFGGGSSGSILFLPETRSTNREKTVVARLPGDGTVHESGNERRTKPS